MSWWGVLAGGVIGTMVLTTGLRLAQEAGWTRMDIPLLLGTAVSRRRAWAEIAGYAIHFANGVVFALGYGLVFAAVGETSWWFGGLLGMLHALFAGGPLVNVLLPAVHPRMGTPWSDSEETPLLEPPGFMLANYGKATAAVTAALHVVYGVIVGAFAAGF